MTVTNLRVMFVKKGTFSSKLKVDDLPCDQITAVEYKPGMFQNGITIHAGKKKEQCFGQPTEGKDRARRMAEYLSRKAPGGAPITKNPNEAKLYAIEDEAKRHVESVSRSSLKKLTRFLDDDEIPAQVTDEIIHDDRHGLNIGGMGNAFGLLAATDRRLIFINGEPFSKDVRSFPYHEVESVSYTKGVMFGSISIWANGLEEKFDKLDSHRVAAFVKHIESQTGLASIPPGPHTPSISGNTTGPAQSVSEYLAQLDTDYQKLFKDVDTRALEKELQPDEAIDRMSLGLYEPLAGLQISLMVATDQRLIFAGPEQAASFPYELIDRVTFTKGLMMGSVSIWMDGVEEKFDKLPRFEIEEWVQHIEGIIG